MTGKLGSFGMVLGIGFMVLLAGCDIFGPPVDPCAGVTCGDGETCVAGECIATDPQAFTDADSTRGGLLYDKWWVVAGADEPTEDHALWATQTTNTRTGADTWRCKECHGWDYKGVDGAYASGSHMTGFTGIFGTTLSAQEVFDKIGTDHGLGAAGLSDEDVWDLAKFVLEGQINTDDIIDTDADNAFTGDAGNGQTLYDNGVGGNAACAVCHGADGLTIEFHPGEFLGTLADGNPWEFQHKVRFGQPGTAMPSSIAGGGTIQDVADMGAYSQTLPINADPEGFNNASSARGGLLYDKWWVVAGVDEPTEDHAKWAAQDTNTRTGSDTWRCKECHGWDYKGVDGAYASGSHLTGFPGIFGTTLSAQDVFDKIGTGHGFGDAGLSDDDVWDLAKFVLQGQIDTDDIIDTDADNAFTGDAGNGQTLYDDGIGGNLACAVCHGADGLTINFKTPPDEEYVGSLADGNPWEFQHKVRFGHPGTAMPASVDVDASNDDVADVGAYSQTLP